jgi:peroxiredoxin
MMIRLFSVALAWICAAALTQAQPTNAPKGPPAELQPVMEKIQEKMQSGKRTEADLAPEIAELDKLAAGAKEKNPEDAANYLFLKARLYMSVFENMDKGTEIVKQIQRELPKTEIGQRADDILASLEKQKKAQALQATLKPGAAFPDFEEKDLDGKALSLSQYKGKVVLVDFWATWCGPCVGELPNVLQTYKKYHDKGFEIVGISLDRSEDSLKKFIKEKEMTWRQYFDGKGWQTKLAEKYGINSIPATYLLDTEGKIIAKGLRGDDLEKEVEKALAKK